MSQISKKADAEAKRFLTQFIEYLQVPRTLNSAQLAALEIETRLHQENRNSALRFSELVEEQKLLKALKLKWVCPVPYKTIVCSSSDPDPILIGTALNPHGYFCFEASLYLHGLLDLPKQIHIAKERTTPQKVINDFKYDDTLLRKEFSKPPRITNRVAKYGVHQYVLTEREYSSEVCIQKKWLSKKRMVEVKLTGLERTLVDCAITPHYVSDLKSIDVIYREAAKCLKMDQMVDVYRALKPRYPYWQRIGFLLQRVDSKKAELWRKEFGNPVYTFFLMKGFTDDCDFDERWKIHFPA